jgi:ribA/ribD-fused uncharacterized protein
MIKEFREKYAPFSSFWKIPIIYESITFPSIEHAFQAGKIKSWICKSQIARIPYPSQVKKMLHFQGVPIRKDWEDINLNLMKELVRQKFLVYPDLNELLLNTNDEEIQEGNYWHDTFWGVDLKTGKGENHLGKILMKVREELRST